MEKKIVAIGLIAALLIASLLVIGAGCQQTGASAQAKELDSELSGLDNANDDINGLDISCLDDSELSDLEGLF